MWIGGATDAGKTSIARGVSRKYGLPAYHYDAHDLRHHERLAQHSRHYASFLAQTLDERWVMPSPEEMSSRAWQAFDDRFPFVLEDLATLSMPGGMPIVAEGFGLTPHHISALTNEPSRFVCLLPTDEFKLASMRRRGKGHFDGKVSDPRRAADNLWRRDRLIADRLREECSIFGIEIIEIDGATSIDELTALIGSRFGLR